MGAYIAIAIIAYAIGSINFSVIFSRKFAGFDVREKGSGNAGTTNMLRTVGKKAAVITLVCDILKGIVSILIALLIGYFVKDVNTAISHRQAKHRGAMYRKSDSDDAEAIALATLNMLDKLPDACPNDAY